MRSTARRICLVVVGLLFSFAYGLFEDQAGEFDWKIENIGSMQQSFSQNQKTFVATAESVIASLNSKDGTLNWRASLPAGTVIHHIIAGRTTSGSTDIFSLTSMKSDSVESADNQHHFLLSSWSSEQGVLRWQLSLGSKKLSVTDLVYDSSRYLITALSGNSIDTATIRGHLHSHWNPTVSNDAQIATYAKNGKQLIISQLILQTKNVPKDVSADPLLSSRIAIGCFIDSSYSSIYSSNPLSLIPLGSNESENVLPKCGNTAILSAVLPSKLTVRSSTATTNIQNVEIKIFSALPDVLVSTLRAVINSDEEVPYTVNDVIFGIASTGTANKQPKISILTLSSNTVTTIDFPSEISDDKVEKAVSVAYGSAFLIMSESAQFFPSFVHCSSASSCASYYITNANTAKNGKNGKNDFKMNLLNSCTGVDSILGVERNPFGGTIAKAISCAKKEHSSSLEKSEKTEKTEKLEIQKNTCSNDMSCSGEYSLQISSSSVSSEEHSSPILSSFSVALPRSLSASTLLFVSTEKVSTSSNELTSLVVYSSLLTASYLSKPTINSTSTPPTINTGNEIWRREETLSNIKQAVIVEDSRNFISSTHIVEGEEEPPTLSERLMMQYTEIKQMILELESSLAALPEILYEHTITGFGIFPTPILAQIGEIDVYGIDVIAERRRIIKKQILPQRDRATKARIFGFNKIAVCFSSSLANIGGGFDSRKSTGSAPTPLGSLTKTGKIGFSGAGLRLTGLDLLTGEVIWTLDPTLESANVISTNESCTENCDEVLFARLVSSHSSSSSSSVSFIVSTKSGTFSWEIEASTGSIVHSTLGPGSGIKIQGPLVAVLSLAKHADDHKGISRYLLIHNQDGKISTSTYPVQSTQVESAAANVLIGTYGHSLDRQSGLLETFKISSDGNGDPVSSAQFPGPLASVSYPNSDDVIDSRYTVLGDHSILMKYVNPHTVLLTYFSEANHMKSNDTNTESGRPVYAALVDTISSKVLYRLLLCKTASLPVHTLLVENHLIVTYWNSKAKRTELSSTALYEGMVDVFGLSPLSYFSALPQQLRDANLSSFSSPLPLGIQRTYVIPRTVTSLHHTVTSRGMAHKNILMGLSGGQLFSLDHRMIHPRRPTGLPTVGEKEEGLVQYNPIIPIIYQNAITLDTRISGEAIHVVTASVRLESTSLVLVFGGLDVFFSRISPSQGFDVLASDFNYPLLILLLVVLALAVFGLRRVHVAKTIKQSWA